MKRVAPHTARNRGPILAVLREVLPAAGTVLEIAAGTGENARDFAGAFPGLRWQPTDIDPEALTSIAAWREERGVPTLLPPLALDVTAPWPVTHADAVLCINMIHITPWSHTEALLEGAARVLPAGGGPRPAGVLILYGPYKRDGRHTAPSNAAFEERLQQRDPRWGIRDLGEVEAAAVRRGLVLTRVVEMPANNLTVVFTRRGDQR